MTYNVSMGTLNPTIPFIVPNLAVNIQTCKKAESICSSAHSQRAARPSPPFVCLACGQAEHVQSSITTPAAATTVMTMMMMMMMCDM